MQNKIVKDNEHVIGKVEDVLKTAYDGNDSFNKLFDGEQEIEINSRIPERDPYTFTPSEILFWVERVSYYDEHENFENEEIQQKHKGIIGWLYDTDQNTVFEGLIDAIRRKRIAPFVGAGISKAYNYPLWVEALEQIKANLQDLDMTEVNNFLESRSYLNAAQQLYINDPQQFNYYIKKKFELTEEKKKEIIKDGVPKLLTKISTGAIITTNYDKIIETVFEIERKSFHDFMHGVQQKNQFVKKLIKGDRCILKLHGDVEYEDTYIFCKDQYDDAYYEVGSDKFDFKKPLPKTLRQIFISHSLLFLGCSLEQDKTLDLFKSIKDDQQFEIPDHYAIMENIEPENARLKRETENRLLKLNIRPIWYNKGDYLKIQEMLSLAIDVVDKKVEFKKMKS